MNFIMKKIRYLLEGVVVYAFYYFFYLLSLELASKVGSNLLRLIGKFVKENKTAKKNFNRCFPTLPLNDKQKIIKNTWSHFGAVIGEIPHWKNLSRVKFFKRIKIINEENIPYNKSILFSGHLGNWELITKIAEEYNIKLNLVYRPSNNPYVSHLINKMRKNSQVKLIPKGLLGIKKILNALNNNEVVAIMIDQKIHNGITVPFFNMDAMTISLPASIALKYKIQLIPLNIIRTKRSYYTATFYKPLLITNSDTKYTIMKKLNSILEGWIRKHPEQWFWFHNRWE